MYERSVTESMYKKYKKLISREDIGKRFDQLGWNYNNEQ